MSFAYQKVKSVSKVMEIKGDRLTKVVLSTMKQVSDLVGATLGPGGCPVLIERQEWQQAAMVTKDGVTVARSLGFVDPIMHVLLEACRDAAVRTANEAGDGTTTATVLAEAIVRLSHEFTKKNPNISSQKVVRALQTIFQKQILPRIQDVASAFLKLDLSTPDGQHTYQQMLWKVAKVSANGDKELADAVMECYEIVGDEGNVTLSEMSGPSGYEVEQIPGYPVPIGYEDSCVKYAPLFITDQENQRIVLDKPLFIVYNGPITELQTFGTLLEQIGVAWQSNRGFRHNVVVVATGFSANVMEWLSLNMGMPTTINVVPLRAPLSGVPGGQLAVMRDIAAYTGAPVLDPISAPLDRQNLVYDENGENCIGGPFGMRVKSFECYRFRSVILSDPDDIDGDSLLQQYVKVVQAQSKQTSSEMDTAFFQERVGKLTGGLARLKVVGSSAGELRERRDRAEDAVCAVRGAIKHGVVPGGGWMLLDLMRHLKKNIQDDKLAAGVVEEILCPALKTPFVKIYQNLGYTDEEIDNVFKQMYEKDFTSVYDAYEQKLVPMWASVLDSAPAVSEAIRNSLSIASLLGTLGGAVVFPRDLALERQEAKETNSFLRDANNQDYQENPANERGM